MSNLKSQLPFALLLSVFVAWLPLPAHAETPKVTAVLSNSDVSIGEVVQLQIRVTGGNGTGTPGEITVDGLEIHPTGTSRNYEMHNFDVSQSVTYNYTILPLKSGTFKIPPQTVRVGTSAFKTPELQLTVAGSNAGGTSQGRANPKSATTQASGGKVAFAELIVTKPSAYVGEMVPVEVRLGFHSMSRARPMEGPDIAGQGFTMQKLQQAEQSRLETINGNTYQVLTFKTAIAAARPGKLEVGPVQAGAIVAVQRKQSGARSRSPVDIFDSDDPFSDPFFHDPFGAFGQQEKISIKSAPATLEVKALPAHAPANFSGAVGNFTMNVAANPTSVQVGDPVTVTAAVSGRGNFDRVTAPNLQDEHGWHKYPPSSKFKQDDNVGISGTKTFETVLSPNEKKQTIPPFEFCFFDPVAEKYVTLKSEAIPIHVEGGSSAPAALSGTAPSTPASTPTATAAPQASASPGDILYQLTERPKAVESFAPLYLHKAFWLAQLIPLLALFGFIGWNVRRAHRQNQETLRTAGWQNESAALMRKLRRDNSEPREYYADAARAVQIKTALATNSDPNVVNAEGAARAFHLDEKAREILRELFERHDELRYGGSQNGVSSLSPEQRREVLELIDHLQT